MIYFELSLVKTKEISENHDTKPARYLSKKYLAG